MIFNISKGLQDNYDAMADSDKDPNTIYITTDTGRIYLGKISLNTLVGCSDSILDIEYDDGTSESYTIITKD